MKTKQLFRPSLQEALYFSPAQGQLPFQGTLIPELLNAQHTLQDPLSPLNPQGSY